MGSEISQATPVGLKDAPLQEVSDQFEYLHVADVVKEKTADLNVTINENLELACDCCCTSKSSGKNGKADECVPCDCDSRSSSSGTARSRQAANTTQTLETCCRDSGGASDWSWCCDALDVFRAGTQVMDHFDQLARQGLGVADKDKYKIQMRLQLFTDIEAAVYFQRLALGRFAKVYGACLNSTKTTKGNFFGYNLGIGTSSCASSHKGTTLQRPRASKDKQIFKQAKVLRTLLNDWIPRQMDVEFGEIVKVVNRDEWALAFRCPTHLAGPARAITMMEVALCDAGGRWGHYRRAHAHA
jgi:hypothetical protein